MNSVDDRVREALAQDAETHQAPVDLWQRSFRAGQRLRRRRKLAVAGSGAAVLIAIGAGSLGLLASGGGGDQVIQPSHGGSDLICRTPGTAQITDSFWNDWPGCRTFHQMPPLHFFKGLDEPTLAAGQLPDGTAFALQEVDGGVTDPVDYDYGWWSYDVGGFTAGNDGAATTGPDYFSLMLPTAVTGNKRSGATSYWLVVVGRPGTVSAEFSRDGSSWRTMTVSNGIAAIKVPRWPRHQGWQIKLADAQGEYANGPLTVQRHYTLNNLVAGLVTRAAEHQAAG